jgi:hypothetical protein
LAGDGPRADVGSAQAVTDYIQRHPKRSGWFKVPFGTSEPLWAVPGVFFEGGQITAHQTHLPLLDPALVDAFLAKTNQSAEAWTARDAWCAEHGFKLRVVQHQAIDFARHRRGVLLFDEMRLGKTLSSLLMDVQWRQSFRGPGNYGPLVIVAPLKTRAVWLGWIKRLYPDKEIGVITGRTFDKQVLQLLTNPDTNRTKAAALLASKARRVVCLTGTPINRFPPDMWPTLNMVASGAWGSPYEFSQRYGDPQPTAHGTTYDGVSNEVELRTRLSEIMLRRRWRDCHADLPPITRSVIVADISQAERNKLDILAGKIKAERANTAANLAAYRRQVTVIKLPSVIKKAEEVLAAGEPVVIGTWHKDFAEKIAEKLRERSRDAFPVFLLHGDIAIAERERRIAAWREHPRAPLIATMAVADVGIDLSHARITIFGEIDYTPAIVGQFEMRTYDPTRPMDVFFVIANHLVDQRIVRSLVKKLSAADPLGVAAAIDAIDALRDVVMGPEEDGDLDRLLEDLLASG